jgi:hypothetical protein
MVILNERTWGHRKRDAPGYCLLIAVLRDYSFDDYIGGLAIAHSKVAHTKPHADAKQDSDSEYDSSYNLWSHRIRVRARSIVSRSTGKDLWVRCHNFKERVLCVAWCGSSFSVLFN